jgi:outer membrane usher protein FimD/PapC
LLEAQDEEGRPLPQGAAVFGEDNNFVTSVVGEGMVFLSNIDGPQTLTVSLPDAKSCRLQVNPEQEPDDDTLYETAPVVCHVR